MGGYELLGLAYDIELARGCPVLQASVDHSADGYGAALGWIQIVRYGTTAQELSIVDVPPQMAQAGITWASWGVRPTFFDTPPTPERESRFRADTFLAFSPDAVISPKVELLRGFSWGYDVHAGRASVVSLALDGMNRWPDTCVILRRHCPGSTFRDM